MSRAASRTASSSVNGSVLPGTTGTPARSMARRAAVLSPIKAMVSDVGPMKIKPAASQAPAKSAFSARNP